MQYDICIFASCILKSGLSNNVRDATQSAVKYLRLILENYVPWRYKELGTVRMQKIRLGSNLDLSKRGTDAEATWPCVISRFEVPVCSRTLLDVLFNSSLVQSFNKYVKLIICHVLS